ncbi:MAG TPA: bifunctional hydroxymethylpyrimidine kinase/phosphomethylpyrimidine kinase [Verrucomicrobiae bacterium]|jgi:hydroxymethylpyrimidine/phosphomethylpyrimidine kinase|nr:bifunctional hydroxymethylpyrimidine kinase/phosphomethylpyrimidine kinase [Verrucomicrobiae bacterium]
MHLSASSPVVLTIAGSDSGGGAGLQADLRTFTQLGVKGATVVTCLTAQNQNAVTRLAPTSPAMVRAQLEAVFAVNPPAAIKTGMLYSAAIINEVVKFLAQRPSLPLVVDPVMISTSGRRLLRTAAVNILQQKLLPLATLVTPNRAEAEVLLGRSIRTPEQLRAAAREINRICGCAALVKGGHLPGTAASLDILFDGKEEWLFSAPRLRGVRLHGTGCAYAAAIAAGLGRGRTLVRAVEGAKQFITQVIYESRHIRTVLARVSG